MNKISEMRGAWKFLPEKSSEIGRFGASRLEFDVVDGEVSIQRTLGHFKMIESMICKTDGSALKHTPAHRIIPETFLSGIYRDLDTDYTLTGILLPEGGLKIEPLNFEHAAWSKTAGGMVSGKTFPKIEGDQIFLSGTKVREMLVAGQRPPAEFTRPEIADILIDSMKNG